MDYLAQHIVLHLHPLVMSQQVVVLACVLLPHGICERLAAEILACAVCAFIINNVVLHKLSSMLHINQTGMVVDTCSEMTMYALHVPSSSWPVKDIHLLLQ